MKAVLMAGGSGTRLRPLTCDMPKPMVPIVNRPIVGHILNLLKRHGFDDVILTLWYLPQVIQNYVKDGAEFGVHVKYAIEADQPLGTAGSVKACQPHLDETFLIISGDSLTDFDLGAAIRYHKEKNAIATLVLTRVPNPLEFGVVITDGEGKITRFLEKPTSSEVFSDTVNTGIYILEPSVLDFLPANASSDFSTDLFPLLLAKNLPMYGYIADGYWCDVGNLETYRQAHYDVLSGHVKVDIPYEQRYDGVWMGESVVIEPGVSLEAPLLVGNNCYIGRNAQLSANTVLGDNVAVGENSSLKRPIVWNGSYIDAAVSLRGCTVGRNVTVKREAQILEGAVIADECIVGEKAVIKPGIKVWPSKVIDPGVILMESLIWGAAAQQSLFGANGIAGLVNVDITPERAVKIGAAYGASLGMGKSVTVSRDQNPASRLISRALVSGLLSVGVNVLNLDDTPVPIARHQVPSLGVAGGVHIRLDPDKEEQVSIEFLDTKGLTVASSVEKKIESAYFKEDFRRAKLHEVGEMSYPARIRERYQEAFLEEFNAFCAIRPLRVVVDYAFLIGSVILPSLLGRLGVETVVLNAYQAHNPAGRDKGRLLQQLSEVVVALKADFGVQMDGNGERIVLVDNRGHLIKDNKLLALLTRMVMQDQPGALVAVPVMAPAVLETLAEQQGGRIIRTKASARSLMATAKESGAAFAGYGGRFIFPNFHAGYDALFTTAMIAYMLAKQDRAIADIVKELPPIPTQHEAVPCQLEQKGRVMRLFAEANLHGEIDLMDGLKIHADGGWVLILPDPVDGIVHLYADAHGGTDQSRQLLERYKERMAGMLAAGG
ncbi:MAG: NTP transferase domain-containing protein [Candidatus Sericytochromatia bacterium]|nr:NTP transferase domain-containing protein [Candidatus Sericytochromatia bacterium]